MVAPSLTKNRCFEMQSVQKKVFVSHMCIAASGIVGERSPLSCTHVIRVCKKILKMLVLTLNSSQLLRYNRLKLSFLFFLNANFLKYSRADWVKETCGVIWDTLFLKGCLKVPTSKTNGKKLQTILKSDGIFIIV